MAGETKTPVDLGDKKIKVIVTGGSVVTCDNPRVEIIKKKR